MMKIVGIVIITISIVLIGIIQYIKLKSRPMELDLYIKILTEYCNELKWNQKSLKEVILDFKAVDFNEYINETIRLLHEKDYLDSLFDSNEKYRYFHLNPEDESVLRNFCFQSGNYGIENEIKLCEKTIKTLEYYKTEAETKFKKLGLFSVKIALICGIWAFILLI